MKTIKVNCSKTYDIFLGKNILNQVPHILKNLDLGSNILLVTDDNVEPLYAQKVIGHLEKDYHIVKYVLPHGEGSKNSGNLFSILNCLADHHFHRNDTVLSLGGGVVGDISGLCASLYMRGINFIQIPTTLLAMVDASIGGKTAIDISQGKNLIGSFYQPCAVICDTSIIRDLPEEIFQEGMAEVIKYNVIENVPIIKYINEGRFDEHLEEVIESCISIKARIVSEDEYEKTDTRKKLNAGHTFAHSLENLSNYKISHGLAVGTGLVYEAALAKELGMCKQSTYEQIMKAVRAYDLLMEIPYSAEELTAHMKSDKKNMDSRISFVLPEELGKCANIRLTEEEVKQIYAKIGVIQ